MEVDPGTNSANASCFRCDPLAGPFGGIGRALINRDVRFIPESGQTADMPQSGRRPQHQERTSTVHLAMSALPLKADKAQTCWHVRFVLIVLQKSFSTRGSKILRAVDATFM
jgi:hypothetical protein